jgi:hypothetical protein
VRYHAEVAHTVLRILCGVILAGGAASAFERSLDLPLINAATAIGESRVESVRTQFHRPYRIPVGRGSIDYIEVVTPFRRIVRIAEDRARVGARPLGQRETLDAAGDRIGLVEFVVELTFHPLNAYVGVPLYEVELVTSTAIPPERLLPMQINRLPRFGARVYGTPPLSPNIPLNVPGPSEPMLGGTVIASFDAVGLRPVGIYDVVVTEQGKELTRVRVNLGNVR